MKLLASDYDGTLLYAQKVMQEDIDAIKNWRENGNLFVMATGRSFESIEKEMKKYDIQVDYYITNNGGVVFDGQGNILYSSYLDSIISLDIMYITKHIEGVVSYVVNDGIHRHRVIVNDGFEEKRYPDLMPDLSEEEVMDLGKYAQIVISMATRELAIDLAKAINTHFSDTVVAYSNNYVVDAVPKGTSKSTGVDFVCEYANVTEMETYTIGDSYNDIPLLEYGVHGSCMNWAVDDVKQHASYCYGSIHEMIQNIQ